MKNKKIKNSDLWSLDYTIAKFVLPRLIKFKKSELSNPHSLTKKQWNKILDQMIFSFSCYKDKSAFDLIDRKDKEFKKGLMLFGKYFDKLWN